MAGNALKFRHTGSVKPPRIFCREIRLILPRAHVSVGRRNPRVAEAGIYATRGHVWCSRRPLPEKLTIALAFAPPLCCRKSLTKSGRAVVEGGREGALRGRMTRFIFIVAILVFAVCGFVARASGQVNVTQEHNNPTRDGLYIDPAFTPSAAATLTRDLNFNGAISGNVYAQPLYIEGGPNGPMVIAVTESNNVYALNAATGTVIWSRNLGLAVTSGLPCGNIN